jgi:hypothetical protein
LGVALVAGPILPTVVSAWACCVSMCSPPGGSTPLVMGSSQHVVWVGAVRGLMGGRAYLAHCAEWA